MAGISNRNDQIEQKKHLQPLRPTCLYVIILGLAIKFQKHCNLHYIFAEFYFNALTHINSFMIKQATIERDHQLLFESLNKKVITFIGYSGTGYEE